MKFIKKSVLAFRGIFKVLWEVNAIARKVDPGIVWMQVITAIVRGVSTLGGFALIGVLLQSFTGSYTEHGRLTVATILIGSVAYGLYVLSGKIFKVLNSARQRIFDRTLDFVLDQMLLGKQKELDVGRLSDPGFAKLKEGAEQRGRDAVITLQRTQYDFISALVGMVSSLGVMSVLNPLLICFAILPALPRSFKSYLHNKRGRALWDHNHLDRRRRWEYHYYLDHREMSVQAKLFGFIEYIWERFVVLSNRIRSSELVLKSWATRLEVWLEVFDALMITAALLYLGYSMEGSELSISKLFFFLGAFRTLNSSVTQLTGVSVDLNSSRLDYRDLEEYLGTSPLIDEVNAKVVSTLQVPRIELKGVSFAYPQARKDALDGCSFTLDPGEKVMIVGHNGSGKTTAMRLIAKVYLPSSGLVLVDNTPTGEILQESLLRHILYVTQSGNVPDLPIDEAVTGTCRESIDHGRLTQAARIVGLHAFICDLPNGYHTQIGADWPGGVDFSTGQLQRLKIASAIYRLLDPLVHVGLFDEPMAHCDVETRECFYQALHALPGKTIVVVAHDPLYLHHFDRVIEMGQGRVVGDIRGRAAVLEYRTQTVLNLTTIQ